MSKIKEAGHLLYVVNPEPIQSVVELADVFIKKDIFSPSLYDYCRAENIDAVITDECDIAVPMAAELNSYIGSFGIPVKIAELFTDKSMMRTFLRQNRFPDIPFLNVTNPDECLEFFRQNGSKIVIKPVNSNSSHGVHSVTDPSQIPSAFFDALHYSRMGKGVIAEKYIDGTEFTVDGIMTSHGHITTAISRKTHFKHNENIASALYFSQSSEDYNYELLRKNNDDLIEHTGLPFGLTHAEYKYCDDNFYLIEMAARGGGNLISAIIAPYMSGIDNYDYLINRSINNDFDEELNGSYNNNRCAVLNFFNIDASEGIVNEIIGEECLKRPEIKSYKINCKLGDHIKQPQSDSTRLGYYIACADNASDLDDIICDIDKNFSIRIR